MCNAEHMENFGTIQSLQFANDVGIKDIILEGDSMSLFKIEYLLG